MKNLKKTGKRFFAMFLSLVMALGIVQTTAFAARDYVVPVYAVGVDSNNKIVSVSPAGFTNKGNTTSQESTTTGGVTNRTWNWTPSGDGYYTMTAHASTNVNVFPYVKWPGDLWNIPSGYTYKGYNKLSSAPYVGGSMGSVVGPGYSWQYGKGNFTIQVTNATGTYLAYYFSVPAAKTFTLNYNANGGSGAPASQSATSAGNSYTFTISNQVPTKAGYTFKGWSTSSSATTSSYQPGNTINVTGTTTLYAVWEAAPAKDVQQTGEGTVTIRKRFVGADMPAAFLMTYDISNEKSGPFASDVIDFTPVSGSTTQYSATIKYPIWTFTGDWTDVEKAQYNSKIVLSELDANIQGKDLTITATGGATIDNDAQTISYTVGASVLSGGTKVITNTYTDNTPPVADKNLTGISKVRLTKNDTIPAGINPDDYNLEEDIVLSTTQTTNLLYLITVNGDVGANYDVEDANVTVVSGSLNGTITGTAAYIYVSQAVTASSLQNGMAVNTAVLTPGENTKFSDGATSKQDTAEVPVITYTNPEPEKSVEQRIAGTDEWIEVDPDYPEVEPGAELRYTVRVQNTNSVTFSGLRVIDDMADGLVLDEDSCEGTVTINGQPTTLSQPSIEDMGSYTKQTWTVDSFPSGAEIVIVYKAAIPADADAPDALYNYAYARPTSIMIETPERSMRFVTVADDDDVSVAAVKVIVRVSPNKKESNDSSILDADASDVESGPNK